jgi:hypothetical protein
MNGDLAEYVGKLVFLGGPKGLELASFEGEIEKLELVGNMWVKTVPKNRRMRKGKSLWVSQIIKTVRIVVPTRKP